MMASRTIDASRSVDISALVNDSRFPGWGAHIEKTKDKHSSYHLLFFLPNCAIRATRQCGMSDDGTTYRLYLYQDYPALHAVPEMSILLPSEARRVVLGGYEESPLFLPKARRPKR